MKRSVWQRVRRILLFCIVQLVIGFLLLEGLARIFDPLGISYMPETARFLDTMIHEQPIGYRLQPGLDGSFNGARYQINSLGFRGPETDTAKGSDERRILFLGDSVVFGVGVDNAQTIPAVLERLSNTPGPPGHRNTVLNMGVPSYNTEQELVQFESLGLSLHPDAVVLMFSANDIEPKDWAFGSNRNWMMNRIQRSYALSLLLVTAYRVRDATRLTPSRSQAPPITADDPRWQRVAAALGRIKQICDQHSIPFTVVYLAEPSDPAFDVLEVEGRSQKIDVLGIRASPDPRWPESGSLKFRNSVIDSHPNVAGNEMWGQLIYEALSSTGTAFK